MLYVICQRVQLECDCHVTHNSRPSRNRQDLYSSFNELATHERKRKYSCIEFRSRMMKNAKKVRKRSVEGVHGKYQPRPCASLCSQVAYSSSKELPVPDATDKNNATQITPQSSQSTA